MPSCTTYVHPTDTTRAVQFHQCRQTDKGCDVSCTLKQAHACNTLTVGTKASQQMTDMPATDNRYADCLQTTAGTAIQVACPTQARPKFNQQAHGTQTTAYMRMQAADTEHSNTQA
jgi:hypothetical protein